MRKLVALLVALLVLGWCGVAEAYWTDLIDQLNTQGLESNSEINQSYVDLSNVSDSSVVSYTYTGIDQILTVNNFSVREQTYMEAIDRITRYVFELTNRYRPDTELALTGITADNMTTRIYTYGTMKDEAMWAVVNGLPECLGNPPFNRNEGGSGGGSSDGSWIDKYSPEQIVNTIAKSVFTINATTYTVNDETKTMDVAPEVKENRTFVPVRYLAYALGVAEDGIKWNGMTQSVTISKDTTTLGLQIGSNIITINGNEQQMDVAPYVKNGRTMLPARWIAEPLGAQVEWDEQNQQVKIQFSVEQGLLALLLFQFLAL